MVTSRDVFVCQTWEGEGAAGIQWVRARDAAEHVQHSP